MELNLRYLEAFKTLGGEPISSNEFLKPKS